jgi:hypothetical protein
MSAPPSGSSQRKPVGFDEMVAARLLRRTKADELHAVWWPIALLADAGSRQYGNIVQDRSEWHYREVSRECLGALSQTDDEPDDDFAERRKQGVQQFVRDAKNILAGSHEDLLRYAVDPGPMQKANPPRRVDHTERTEALLTLLRLALTPAERLALGDRAEWRKRPIIAQIERIAEAELGIAETSLRVEEETQAEADFILGTLRPQRPREFPVPRQQPSVARTLARLQDVRAAVAAGRQIPSELEVHSLGEQLRRLGAIALVADAAAVVAEVQWAHRNASGGEETLREAIAFARDHRDRRGEALASWELGKRLIASGRSAEGETLCLIQVAYRHEIGHTRARETEAELKTLVRAKDSPDRVGLPSARNNATGSAAQARGAAKKAAAAAPKKKTVKQAATKKPAAKKAVRKVSKKATKKAVPK